ncbi:type I polyketide synthase [Streptomyces turgidiscabies]|uniref:Putative type I polyketide synthase n=4 Tax=Streptomyces TaxID=1883 RepID=A0A090AV26_9ACTN|nr:type I polyketide synthase [Streptomyces turgidiscabies]MDX3495546.1 type I polyketide synthase [Streptomyces turgidiscabies]BAP59885.1 putative type I polyketide synthase [Streptomyces turgidiscabies]GAQ70234.1 phthiocerol synthesis polyketide synthase type I [Streptomyces turgidiscabies]
MTNSHAVAGLDAPEGPVRPSATPVAIVGMSVLLPGAADLDAYWRNLLAGTDAITEVPDGRWDADAYYRPDSAGGRAVADQVYCRRGGFVDGLAEVEVTRFGIMPNSVSGTEPDQLIALNVAAAALADAGGGGGRGGDRGELDNWLPDRHRVGVVLGRGGYLTPGLVRLDQRVRTAGQLVRTLGELLPDLDPAQLDSIRTAFTDSLGPDSPESAIGLVPNLAASRVANRLDLRGPAYTVDAACASSLVAVDQAVNELASGRCDVMLAGGVHHCHDITLWSVFSQLRALSPSQRIRPFHRGADGILIGEGTGVVVLKRLADAERDGDRIYAVIRGTGVASDGRAAGLVNPDPGGQAHAVRQAWRAAGLDPAQPGSIGLLEAHGTATPAGDNAELATLAEVFGPRYAGSEGGADTAVIGSVKSMIGHTMPAAGVAGLVKAALAVHHGMLLPTLHCDDPNPALAATRFRPLDRAAPWETTAEQPVRRAAVNAFGFGGINAHVVLEEAPGARTRAPASPLPSPGPTVTVAEPERVLLLAADTPEALAALLDTDDTSVLAAGLDAGRPHPQAGRSRLGIVDPTAKRLTLARRAVAKGRAWQGRSDVWFRPEPLRADTIGELGGLAFVFPGLEGDFEPRVDDIAAHFGLTDVLPAGERAEVGDVGRHGFGVVGVGLLLDGALRRMGVVPDAVAGHSVGEWTAMVAAGLYDGDEVGAFMATFDPDSVSVPGLAFGALGAPAERVLAALAEEDWADAGIVLSHDNAPGQSMVCGPDTAVEAFVRAFRARGVLSQVLPFQSGFHTPMLAPYLAPIEQAASSFRLKPPTVPVWSGTTAAPFPAGESAVRELFVRHLLEPVRFRQLVEAMYTAGHRTFIQVGTGQLGSLIGDTLSGRDHLVVAANSPHRGGLAQLRRVATALWVSGRTTSPALPRTTDATGSADMADIAGIAHVTGVPAPRAAGPSVRSTAPADTSASVRRGRPSTRPPVRLDLSGALVSLDEATLTRLRAELSSEQGSRPGRVRNPARPSVTEVPAAAAPQGAGPSRAVASAAGPTSPLDALAARFPAAAELGALLRETADTAAELIGAGQRRPGSVAAQVAPVIAPHPAQNLPTPRAASPLRHPRSTTPGARTLPPTPLTPPATQAAPPPWRTTVHVSPDTMPYLLDHCFFPQRPGWPDVADRWPVVPATTIVQHMMEAAQCSAAQTHPGTRAAAGPVPVPVAVHGARFDQWLTATPPVDVDVTVTPVPATPTHRAVSFGPRARATVELADGYPEMTARPTPWPTTPTTERAPDHTAAQLYSERWMFHGPAFQGVTELTALGEAHVRGVITTPTAPGSLLDNVGQILGYWIMATRTSRTVVFPVGMRTMRFYGPHPEPGTDVGCFVRITSLTDTVLEADVQLTVGGQVWAELSGWQDRRFDNDPQTRPVERFPERNTLSQARPGGWVLLHERWPDLASRDLIMRNSLGGEERSQYERHAPRGRRQWLLGRIAAKDAVRRWLWEREGEGDVFPAEIRVHNEATGRPYVTGTHGRTLPPLEVSLAHRAEAAVAIVRPSQRGSASGDRPDAGQGPGIDIEEVVERDASTLATALGPAELALLRARSGAGGESEALWFTRFWAAKEAVAKAEGTGFGGRPRDFAVWAATDTGDRLTVSGRLAPAYTVHCEQTGNPPGLPDRTYVVAWTTGPAEEVAAEQGELER